MNSARNVSIQLKMSLYSLERKKGSNQIKLDRFLDALASIVSKQIGGSDLTDNDLPTLLDVIDIPALGKPTSLTMVVDKTNEIVARFSANVKKIDSYYADLHVAIRYAGVKPESGSFFGIGLTKEQRLVKQRQDYLVSLTGKINECKKLDDLHRFNLQFMKLEMENTDKKKKFDSIFTVTVKDLKKSSSVKEEIKPPVTPLVLKPAIKPSQAGSAPAPNSELLWELGENIKDIKNIVSLVELREKYLSDIRYNMLVTTNKNSFDEAFYKKAEMLYYVDKSQGKIASNIDALHDTYDKIFLAEQESSNLQNKFARIYIKDVFMLKLKLAPVNSEHPHYYFDELHEKLTDYKKYFNDSGFGKFFTNSGLSQEWNTLSDQIKDKAKTSRQKPKSDATL